MSEKMPCSITDGRQYDDGMYERCDTPDCNNEACDSGYCWECEQERNIEAGDALYDSRKESALTDDLGDTLEDITRTLGDFRDLSMFKKQAD